MPINSTDYRPLVEPHAFNDLEGSAVVKAYISHILTLSTSKEQAKKIPYNVISAMFFGFIGAMVFVKPSMELYEGESLLKLIMGVSGCVITNIFLNYYFINDVLNKLISEKNSHLKKLNIEMRKVSKAQDIGAKFVTLLSGVPLGLLGADLGFVPSGPAMIIAACLMVPIETAVYASMNWYGLMDLINRSKGSTPESQCHDKLLDSLNRVIAQVEKDYTFKPNGAELIALLAAFTDKENANFFHKMASYPVDDKVSMPSGIIYKGIQILTITLSVATLIGYLNSTLDDIFNLTDEVPVGNEELNKGVAWFLAIMILSVFANLVGIITQKVFNSGIEAALTICGEGRLPIPYAIREEPARAYPAAGLLFVLACFSSASSEDLMRNALDSNFSGVPWSDSEFWIWITRFFTVLFNGFVIPEVVGSVVENRILNKADEDSQQVNVRMLVAMRRIVVDLNNAGPANAMAFVNHALMNYKHYFGADLSTILEVEQPLVGVDVSNDQSDQVIKKLIGEKGSHSQEGREGNETLLVSDKLSIFKSQSFVFKSKGPLLGSLGVNTV